MPDISFPTTPEDLSNLLCHLVEDFSSTAFVGQPISACIHPGIYITPDVMEKFMARPTLQAGVKQQLGCHQHRLELNWHNESVSCLRSSPIQLPPHTLRQSHLVRPSILIRPPFMHH